MKWLNNFSAKIGTYAGTLGLNPDEVSDIVADAAQFAAYVTGILTAPVSSVFQIIFFTSLARRAHHPFS